MEGKGEMPFAMEDSDARSLGSNHLYVRKMTPSWMPCCSSGPYPRFLRANTCTRRARFA